MCRDAVWHTCERNDIISDTSQEKEKVGRWIDKTKKMIECC